MYFRNTKQIAAMTLQQSMWDDILHIFAHVRKKKTRMLIYYACTCFRHLYVLISLFAMFLIQNVPIRDGSATSVASFHFASVYRTNRTPIRALHLSNTAHHARIRQVPAYCQML